MAWPTLIRRDRGKSPACSRPCPCRRPLAVRGQVSAAGVGYPWRGIQFLARDLLDAGRRRRVGDARERSWSGVHVVLMPESNLNPTRSVQIASGIRTTIREPQEANPPPTTHCGPLAGRPSRNPGPRAMPRPREATDYPPLPAAHWRTATPAARHRMICLVFFLSWQPARCRPTVSPGDESPLIHAAKLEGTFR